MPKIWRCMTACLLAAVMAAGAAAHADGAEFSGRDLRVATYNKYLGADLAPLPAAPADRFNEALLDVLGQVAANRFPDRARAQARLLAAAKPDLIGLQEVWHYQCQDLPPAPGACADPTLRGAFVDQLSIALDALRAAGLRYRVAAVVRNFDTADIVLPVGGGELRGLPFTIGGKNGLLLAQDRDVILARPGIDARPVAFPGCRVSVDGCLFATSLVVPIPALPGVSVEYKRGFVGVDAQVRGRRYRFVNTHLEVEEPQPGNPASMFVQSAQAGELIAALAATPLRGRDLVLVGDLNSSPDDVSPGGGIVPPYQLFAAAGFADAWPAFRGAAAGFTCCQAADLRNGRSLLTRRIDLVLFADGTAGVRGIERLGEAPADRTPPRAGRPRLWPSDHAGVAAALRF
jgi:endonuclease/exonuclease/phosphatase family metal-dependent hydrolase